MGLLDWIYGPSMTERFIAHLETELAQVRAQVLHERARAEAAINQLLAQAGGQAVTRPDWTPDPVVAELQTLLTAEGEEFAQAGRV